MNEQPKRGARNWRSWLRLTTVGAVLLALSAGPFLIALALEDEGLIMIIGLYGIPVAGAGAVFMVVGLLGAAIARAVHHGRQH
jgi:hypothetical protein